VKARHKKQTLAENIQVSSEWTEITPEKPLQGTEQIQRVMLSIEDYESMSDDSDAGNIKLKNGTEINPEIQIVDENGKVYELRAIGLRNGDVVFSLEKGLLPRDVTYKNVGIRSDKPFPAREIYWYDYSFK
jgi:hypothetical protein